MYSASVIVPSATSDSPISQEAVSFGFSRCGTEIFT